jgi:REP-associated tyrosine transposase
MIFCPKCRRKVFYPPLDTRLKELILEKQEAYGYRVLGMEVMLDHVHLLLDVNPQIGIAKIVRQIKEYTAHTLREAFPWLKKRLPSVWTRSKFISSVGTVTLEVIQRYIETQKGV